MSPRPFRKRLLATAGALAMFGTAHLAHARTFTVTRGQGVGPDSFVGALDRANRHPGGDTIRFRKSLSGPVSLPDGVAVTPPLNIIDSGRRHVVVTGGRVCCTGLEFYVRGDVPKKPSRIEGLRTHRVTISTSDPIKLSIRDSVITGKGVWRGVAAYGDAGRVSVIDSRLSNWEHAAYGYANTDHALRVRDSRITGNVAGISAYFEGRVDVKRTTITGNTLGVYAHLRADVSILNSTLDANGLPGVRGRNALATDGSTIELGSSTLTEFRDGIETGQLGVRDDGRIVIGNSVLSGEPACDAATSDGAAGSIESSGGNVIENPGECETFLGDVIADPLVGPLTDNGGPTKTRALRRGSPAIDAASRQSPPRDQRGHKRDRHPDSGSYER